MENKEQATPQPAPNPKPNPTVKHQPTLSELVGTSAFILLSTLIAILLFANEFEKAEAYKFSAAVKWSNSAKYDLKRFTIMVCLPTKQG
ncbi:MAG: hypothetical protein IPN76_14705 [Saprospiraceae bacterium]|nr:hypothetical protein [Saprospiraceae bacterium]